MCACLYGCILCIAGQHFFDSRCILQTITGATGVYVCVKDGEVGAIAGAEDEEAFKCTLRYIGASHDHAHMTKRCVLS
jgi:hypothetical protein